MTWRVQPRIDLMQALQQVADRLRVETDAIRTNVRLQTTSDHNFPVLAESLSAGTFSLTGGMSMLGYQGGDIHNAPTVALMRSTGAVIVQSDTRVDPPLVPQAREFGGQAGQMLAPVHHESEFCGFIAVHGDGEPRHWSQQDQDALRRAVTDAQAILATAVWFDLPGHAPLQHLLLVLSDPVPGHEQEYDEWYSGTHIEQTLRTPGWSAARRFRLADAQLSEHLPAQRHLALYDVTAEDAAEAVEALRARSGEITPSDAISPDDVVAVYTPITERIEAS